MSNTQTNYVVELRNGFVSDIKTVNLVTNGIGELFLQPYGESVYFSIVTAGQCSFYGHPAHDLMVRLGWVGDDGNLYPSVMAVINATVMLHNNMLFVVYPVPDNGLQRGYCNMTNYNPN